MQSITNHVFTFIKDCTVIHTALLMQMNRLPIGIYTLLNLHLVLLFEVGIYAGLMVTEIFDFPTLCR